MLKKLLFTFVILSAGCLVSMAQVGALRVVVSDKSNNETIPGAAVIVEQNGVQAGIGGTDINGVSIIKPLVPGKYTVKIKFVGFQDVEVRDVVVSSDKTSYLEQKMSAGVVLKEAEIVSYVEPLVDPDTKISNTVTRKEFERLANKDINAVASTGAGVYQSDAGKDINVRGSRSDDNIYIIDGQRVIGGSPNLPQQGIEQITTITGGLPAQYGDATGAVIIINTRGPQSKLGVGAEAYTSQLLDAYGYDMAGFNLSGPLLTQKDTATGTKRPVLGFFISGQALHQEDASPSAIGRWKVKDDVLKNLQENPLRPNFSTGGTGFLRSAEFVNSNDLQSIKASQNAAANNLAFSGKIDFKPTNNLNITLGGSVSHDNNHDFVYQYMLFNTENNPQHLKTDWRVYGRLTQKFSNATAKEEEKSASIIKNAFYTLQMGYSQSNEKYQDDSHTDNFFDYGYIGKFTQHKSREYAYNATGPNGAAYYQSVFKDDTLKFEPGTKNPSGVNYTKQLYDFYSSGQAGYVGTSVIKTNTDVTKYALMNGDNATDAYGMWKNTGRQYPSYVQISNNKFDISTSFSADVKNHAIQAGFDYDQRSESAYSLAPVGLWTLARQITNLQLKELDTTSAHFNSALSGTYDYFDYERKYDASTQRQFDKSLREKLGKPVNGTEWLDIDSYDPSTFSVNMFSADDLLNKGNSYVSYYGYDYTGKKLNKHVSLDDFFTKTDSRGDLTRSVGAYNPIYVAGYIQDKFDFRDLKFNVGVRIDRFDANQKVLKDKYLLNEALTAGNLQVINSVGKAPSNIGDNYVVYVNDRVNPTAAVGYRNGDTWYNAQGVQIADPKVLAAATTTGQITPFLLDPSSTAVTANVFKDYVPQINVMPRIGLSFPISDVANFFAHYDIIAQRPSSSLSRFDPSSYYYLEDRQNPILLNPDLKPQKTINYELGFEQVLNAKRNSVLKIQGFYLEKRNQIQLVNVNQAFPKTYLTFGNIDFSTVKGITASYDLRRTGNVSLTASYTLQFAEGTGSGAQDALNLLNSGQPNLRFLVPLNFDQRHAIKANIDYHYASGSDYDGPVWTKHKGADNEKIVQLLSEFGANLTFNAGSGTPYSRSSGVINTVDGGRSGLKGSLNGSNLPWTYRFDLRIDKQIKLEWGKKEGEEKKRANLNVNLTVLNLLNRKNILAVYGATGNPNNDGFLASAKGQTYLNQVTNAQSYVDLYNVYTNNPNNYTLPRRIRLGVSMSF